MEISEQDARRILRWYEIASREGGFPLKDDKDHALVAKIREAFPVVAREEKASLDLEHRLQEAEQNPQVQALRQRLRGMPQNSPDYDQTLEELVHLKQSIALGAQVKEGS